MTTHVEIMPCVKCLTRIDLLFKNHNLNPIILSDFIKKSLENSITHYELISPTLSKDEKSIYQITHMQARLMLSLLRGLNLTTHKLP